MSWDSRSPEIAHSLNPAFCGRIIHGCAVEHARAAGRAMPYFLSHLVLPIVLHKKTRESMPSTSRKRMHPWLAENQRARIGFDQRARAMIPFTNEALILLIRSGWLEVTSAGDLAGGAAGTTRGPADESHEVADCARKAKTVGGWFAPYSDPAEVFRMWGVKP